MTRHSNSIEATLELVRAGDPLRQGPTELPDTEAELRILVANLPSTRARPASRRLRRRAVRIGVVAVGAAAATVVALNVVGPGGHSGGFVSQARAAEIVSEIQHKLAAYAPGEVIETLTETHETAPGLSLSSTYNTWQSTTAPYVERVQLTGGGHPSYETTIGPEGIPQIYDSAQNTVYEPSAQPYDALTAGPGAGTWTLTVPRAVAWVSGVTVPANERGTTQLTITDRQAQELRDGDAAVFYSNGIIRDHRRIIATKPFVDPDVNIAPGTLQGVAKRFESRGTRVKLDGTRAIEIVIPEQGTYWFSAKTFVPLKFVNTIPVDHNGSSAQGDTVYTTYYKAYKVLKGAAAQRLLSIQDAHPTATAVYGWATFEAEALRLG